MIIENVDNSTPAVESGESNNDSIDFNAFFEGSDEVASENVGQETITDAGEGEKPNPTEPVIDGNQENNDNAPEGAEPKPKLDDPDYDPDWWKKEKRFEGDPQKLAKTFKDLEKKFSGELAQTKGNVSKFSKLLEQHGSSFDKAEDFFNDMANLKNKFGYFENFLNDPKYKDSVFNFFQDLETKALQEAYPGMNRQQIQEMVELRQQNEAIDEKFQKFEAEKMQKENESVIEKSLAKIEEFSKSRGFEFNDNVKNKLLQHAIDNNLDPKYLYHTFLELHSSDLDKSYRQNIEKGIMSKLEKNKEGTIINSSSPAPANKGKTAGQMLADFF